MSGQSIMDRVVAAKHSIAGQGLAKSVCKATTEEVMGPKKKHLDYLLQCTNEPNVSIPQLADLLIERTQHTNWVVVYKSLITIHNLMNYGNERFTQYLASNNCTFNLNSFLDKGGVQASDERKGYDMSTFIRRYAKYLNEKAFSYRSMAFDFCKVKRGKDDGLLRTMNTDKLLKTLPILQQQVDGLLEFDCSPNELTNGVINACFMLLFKDLIRLFACYNDGIINLLEKYFDMNKKQCKDALDIYKRFLVRMDKVSEFLKVAENVGIDKGDIPDLAKAPSSLLDALEQHLQQQEGKKGQVTPTGIKPAGFTSAVNAMVNNSSIQVSEEERKKILDDENKRLQQLKEQHDVVQTDPTEQDQRMKELNSSQTVNSQPPSQQAPSTNPFADTGTNSLFGAQEPARPSDDLLSLNTSNPFADSVQNVMQMNTATSAMSAPSPNAFGAPAWGTTANAGGGTFTSEADFAKVFQTPNTSSSGFDAFGEVMQPQGNTGLTAKQKDEKLIQGDLNISLAQLAGNLNINGPASQVKKTQHDWQPKGEQKLTGGTSFQARPVSNVTTWGAGYSQPMTTPPLTDSANVQMTGPRMGYPAPAPAMGAQPFMPMGMAPAPAMGMGMQPMYGGMQPGMQPMAMGQPRPPVTQPANDPFGAL